MSLSRQNSFLRIEMVNIGEGYNGDYNPNDPEDCELLRVDVYYKKDDEGSWLNETAYSYCTCFPVDEAAEKKQKALNYLFDQYNSFIAAHPGESLKSLSERMSYLAPSWV